MRLLHERKLICSARRKFADVFRVFLGSFRRRIQAFSIESSMTVALLVSLARSLSGENEGGSAYEEVELVAVSTLHLV